MKKVRLVDDWRDWWRWHSTKMIVILGAFPAVFPEIWTALPQEFKDALPEGWMKWISLGLMFIALYTRMTVQVKKVKKDD